MIPRNTSVVVQNMFSITPKTLNAVNMVLGSFIDKLLGVINHQMFTKALQGLIASKGICIVNRALASMVLNMGQKPPKALSSRVMSLLCGNIGATKTLRFVKPTSLPIKSILAIPLVPSLPKIQITYKNSQKPPQFASN